MLVLTRRLGENIIIGNEAEIIIHCLHMRGNQIQIGITAPKMFPVYRQELYNRIRKEAVLEGKIMKLNLLGRERNNVNDPKNSGDNESSDIILVDG